MIGFTKGGEKVTLPHSTGARTMVVYELFPSGDSIDTLIVYIADSSIRKPRFPDKVYHRSLGPKAISSKRKSNG